MKLSSARYLVWQGVRNVWTNRVMSFASFCILMVSILMIGLSLLFVGNINRIIGGIEDKNEVSIFLADNVSQADIDNMRGQLQAMDNVGQIVFYSKEQAFEDMKASMENAEEIFEYIDESPLNDAYRIRVKDISRMSETVFEIKQLNNIEEVTSPDDFVSLLTDIRKIIAVISVTIIISLAVVSLIIISNSARASVHTRRKEISIMKYVGATNGFIRVPFFIEGLITGVMAGGVAALLTWFGYDSLIDVLSEQMTLWNALGIHEFIQFADVSKYVVGCYICAGALIGSLGCAASVRKHTNV